MSGSCAHSLRYFDIVSPGDLDIVNENIRANNGVFSFRLMRFCTTGKTRVTASAYGVSFPGTQIGNVTYYSMSPTYVGGSEAKRGTLGRSRRPAFVYRALLRAGNCPPRACATRTRRATAACAFASPATSATERRARVRAMWRTQRSLRSCTG